MPSGTYELMGGASAVGARNASAFKTLTTTCAWGQVLLGYREIPKQEKAIVSVLNPPGAEDRMQPRVWNNGDGCVKLVTYRRKDRPKGREDRDAEGNETENYALERVSSDVSTRLS